MKRKHVIAKNNEPIDEIKKTKLQEAHSLHHANLNKLQIDQLLNEVKISDDKKILIGEFVSQLKAALLSMPSNAEQYQLSDSSWLEKKFKSLPIRVNHHTSLKGSFRFVATKNVQVIGSLGIDACNRRHGSVDIAIEIPKECIQDKDYLNERYLIKRAIYLAHIASHLKKVNSAQQIQYSYHHGCHVKPVLLVKSSISGLANLTFVLHMCLPKDSFKLGRFHITKNNVRSRVFNSDLNGAAADLKDEATPHYNSWLLSDLTMYGQNKYLEDEFGDRRNIKDGIQLLKVWLHQRQLDSGFGNISGFIISMYVAYLLVKNKLTTAMSSYHIFRKTLMEIAQDNWSTDAITLAVEGTESDISNRPTLDDFQRAFSVVFVDITGYVNLCADVSLSTYQLLKYEAQLSVSYMDTSDAFQALFMKPLGFMYKYDQTFQIRSLDALKQKASHEGCLISSVIDHCGDFVNAGLPYLSKMLCKALGERVKLLAVKPTVTPVWDIGSPAPDMLTSQSVWFGLIVDPQQSTVSLDLGPFGGTKEADEFREFWKEKSELRRFPDGSIREAVVWQSDSLADKRKICSRIIRHILLSHVGISVENVKFFANQFDALLHSNIKLIEEESAKMNPSCGTGEEFHAAVISTCDDLVKQLHKAVSTSNSLHLTINSVNGIDPVFRYTEVFPALPFRDSCKVDRCGNRLVPLSKAGSQSPMYQPALSVLCLLEGSGKWPENLEAIRRLKANYYLDLSKSLSKTAGELLTAVFTDHLDILKDGYIFRVKIGFTHEIVLHKKQQLPDGRLKLSNSETSSALEYQYTVLPRLTSCLHGLHLQNNSFGAAVRLSKRWLASQMLLRDYIVEEAVELLVASLYISPEPFAAPGSPLVGFLRFLHLVSSHDWQREPLIVNVNNELTQTECDEISAKFTKERSTLPIMFLSTPFDRYSQIWTKKKPSVPILQRLARLASEACKVLDHNITYSATSSQSDLKQIFRTSVTHFDAVIHLNDCVSAHRQCIFESQQTKTPCCKPFGALSSREKEVWPVVDYDPVHQYIEELRVAFDHLALFFHNVYGGSSVGVIWKPQALQPGTFTNSQANCHFPDLDSAGKDVRMVLDRDAVYEDFIIMGNGLVADVGVKNSDSTFVSFTNGTPFNVLPKVK